jgi:hypothetical protein
MCRIYLIGSDFLTVFNNCKQKHITSPPPLGFSGDFGKTWFFHSNEGRQTFVRNVLVLMRTLRLKGVVLVRMPFRFSMICIASKRILHI